MASYWLKTVTKRNSKTKCWILTIRGRWCMSTLRTKPWSRMFNTVTPAVIFKYQKIVSVTGTSTKIESTLCQKIVNHFLSKSTKFCMVRTIQFFFSNFTSMWSNYLSSNVWRDFRLPMSASAMVTQNALSENQFLL